MSDDEISAFTYLVCATLHLFSEKGKKGLRKASVTIISFTGIMAKVVEDHERLKLPSANKNFFSHFLQIFFVSNTNALNKVTSPSPSPLEGEGEGGGKRNYCVCISCNPITNINICS